MYTFTIVVLLFPITVVNSIVHIRPPRHGPFADPNHNVFDHAVDHVNNPLFDYHDDGTDSSNSDGGLDTSDQTEVPNNDGEDTPTQQQGSLRGLVNNRVEEPAPQAALEPVSAPIIFAPPEISCVNYAKQETNPYDIHPSLSISKDSIDFPPYIVSAIACGTILSMGTNYGHKTTTESTWVTNDKSMGTNYGHTTIWEAEADDFIWEDVGSIYKGKKPGEPDIDILIDSDGSLFEDTWPNARDYDLIAKRIWGEESGDFIVKLIWEAEADDFIIQVGKASYSVRYDIKQKKGVIVKK